MAGCIQADGEFVVPDSHNFRNLQTYRDYCKIATLVTDTKCEYKSKTHHFLPPVALVHAASINSATPSTPSPVLTQVNSVGPWSRIRSASRFITSSEAPT